VCVSVWATSRSEIAFTVARVVAPFSVAVALSRVTNPPVATGWPRALALTVHPGAQTVQASALSRQARRKPYVLRGFLIERESLFFGAFRDLRKKRSRNLLK